jgi:TolA-binding protein
LADLSPEDDPAKVALLIQSARQAPDEALPLVKWRIQNTLRRRTEWNRRGLRLVLAGALVFLAGGIVGAIAGPLLGSRRRSAPPQLGATFSPAQAVRHSHRRVPAQAIPSPPADEPLPTTEAPALPAPAVPPETKSVVVSDASAKPKAVAASVAATTTASRPMSLRPSAVVERRRAPLAEPASLAPPPLAAASPPPPDEHSLLKTALQRLRTAHDPVSALAALDYYRVRFPNGGLAPEAAMLRAEALLQIGRKDDALVELDRLSLGQMPNSDERYVVRGELRVGVGRWREALGDFDVVLRGKAGEKADIGAASDTRLRDRFERALWGRALARSRLGDDAGARADLRDCLRLFPGGRFAPEAARLLGEHR